MLAVKRGGQVMKSLAFVCISFVFISLFAQIASAGVGLKWDLEAKLVPQGERTCFTYAVYNPWPQGSYAKIDVSDELKPLLQSQEADIKLVPANTPSAQAIPLEFCFNTPYVYDDYRNCLVGSYLCEQSCPSEQKEYAGEVLVSETGDPNSIANGGGSAVSVAVSAPLKIRVVCNPHSRDWTAVYVIVALIALAIVLVLLKRKKTRSRGRKK